MTETMSKAQAITELTGLAIDQMEGTSEWPKYEAAIAAVSAPELPAALLRWMVDTEERFGYTAIVRWVPMVQAVFVPGTGWKHLPLDEQVAFRPGLAQGAALGGITALMIAFGPVAADFQIQELTK